MSLNPTMSKPNPCPLPSGSLIKEYGHLVSRRVRELLGESGILEYLLSNVIIDLRKKSVKKMTQCSVKKEIIPQVSSLSGKPRDGALISFSGMESFLGLFSQSGVFVSFGGPKERGGEQRQYNLITGNQAGLKTLAC